MSENSLWTVRFHDVYAKGVSLYESGKRGSEDFFGTEDLEFLKSIGCTAQELYDFIEDWVKSKDPDFGTALLLASLRREYFLTVQKGIPSSNIVESSSLPPKDAELEGIVWLPRIIEKAKVKLQGEMNPDLMYGCGGDRKFSRDNNVHLADFLKCVWTFWDNQNEIVTFVKSQRKEAVAP